MTAREHSRFQKKDKKGKKKVSSKCVPEEERGYNCEFLEFAEPVTVTTQPRKSELRDNSRAKRTMFPNLLSGVEIITRWSTQRLWKRRHERAPNRKAGSPTPTLLVTSVIKQGVSVDRRYWGGDDLRSQSNQIKSNSTDPAEIRKKTWSFTARLYQASVTAISCGVNGIFSTADRRRKSPGWYLAQPKYSPFLSHLKPSDWF